VIREDVLNLIEHVAEALGDELDRVVFVGGTVPSLYEGHADIRPTKDVDCAAHVTRLEYNDLTERLRKRGFQPVMDADAPVCRFRLANGLLVDVMPADISILGFTNSWYAEAIERAEVYTLPSGKQVRAITPHYFLATKFEAFRGRGKNNYAMSHDLEDIVALLVAQPALFDEIAAADTEVTRSLLVDLGRLAGVEDFLDTVPFYFPGASTRQQQAGPFTERLLALRRVMQEKGD
jgi:hypothetical protein